MPLAVPTEPDYQGDFTKHSIEGWDSFHHQTARQTPHDEGVEMSVDLKLEVVVVPVTDVDRAKRFYTGLGWRLDADFVKGDEFRGVQVTPPGSPCSIHFGKGITPAAPGSARAYLVVSDIVAARAELVAHGAAVSEVIHRAGPGGAELPGPDPARHSYASSATFSDPDGNTWVLQEVTARLPGRVDASETAFSSTVDLAAALLRAANAHGAHEKKLGHRDEQWQDWYAEYMVKEQKGEPLPA
jgi:catechol 2,3-dioxygenase-like lactoylglutathione lyase family enzyme